MRPPSSLLLAIACAAVAAVLAAAGCASDGMKISVASDPKTNGGAPFYAVVRAIDGTAYVTDAYETVASKVFAPQPDPSILRSVVIYPGQDQTIRIEKPPQEPTGVGIYFLFTAPGERWKAWRNPPLPKSVDIELAGNQIVDES